MKIYTRAVSVFLFLYFSSLLVSLPGKTCSSLKERDAQKVFTDFLINLSFRSFHVIGVCLSSQSAPEKKNNQNKKPTHLCAPHEFLPKKTHLIIKQYILYFWLFNKQTFHMPSLRDLRFVFCSRDLDVRRAQRIIGFFYLTHKSTRSGNPSGIRRKIKTESNYITTTVLLSAFSSTALGNSRETGRCREIDENADFLLWCKIVSNKIRDCIVN